MSLSVFLQCVSPVTDWFSPSARWESCQPSVTLNRINGYKKQMDCTESLGAPNKTLMSRQAPRSVPSVTKM